MDDRLSVLAGVTVAPLRRRLDLYFQVHDHNLRFEEVMAFLRLLHQHLRRKFILVLDGYSSHHKAVRLLQEAGVDGSEVEWLPGYAPELNPAGMLWNHTKYADLANFIPEDVHHLRQAVSHSIEETRKTQERRPRRLILQIRGTGTMKRSFAKRTSIV